MQEKSLSEFGRAVEGRGFRRLAVPVPKPTFRTWYEHERSTERIKYYAVLDYKPNLVAYGMQVGVTAAEARKLILSCLPEILTYLHPSAAKLRVGVWPCWTLFDVGRTLDWGLLTIPSPLARESWPQELERAMTEIFTRLILPVESESALLELLFRDDPPFEWFASGSLLRVAEIVALSQITGVDLSDVRPRFAPFRDRLSKAIQGSRDFDEMIDAFARCLSKAKASIS